MPLTRAQLRGNTPVRAAVDPESEDTPRAMDDAPKAMRLRSPPIAAKAKDRRAAFIMEAERVGEYFRTQLHGSKQPRQVLFLVIGVAALVWVAYKNAQSEGSTFDTNVRLGLVGAVIVFLVVCILQMPDSLMVRPHPAYWRVVHGCGIVYLSLLAFLFVQNLDSSRQAVRYLAPAPMGRADPFQGHDVLQCAINKGTILRQLTSIWFWSHLIGWTLAVTALRSFTFTLLGACVFELMEMSLQFLIPEFQECWCVNRLSFNFYGGMRESVCGREGQPLMSSWLAVQVGLAVSRHAGCQSGRLLSGHAGRALS
jgi:hypothetical protein